MLGGGGRGGTNKTQPTSESGCKVYRNDMKHNVGCLPKFVVNLKKERPLET